MRGEQAGAGGFGDLVSEDAASKEDFTSRLMYAHVSCKIRGPAFRKHYLEDLEDFIFSIWEIICFRVTTTLTFVLENSKGGNSW